MKWCKEDIEKVEKFIEIKNKGYYADGAQLTEVYNRVLEKNVNVTNCGSCLRGRVQELENALNQFKRLSEKVKSDEASNDTKEENNEPVEEKKRIGRPKKK
jgi:hypothetical protein